MIDPNHKYDEQVVEFFNSVKFLGGERTVNFIIKESYVKRVPTETHDYES